MFYPQVNISVYNNCMQKLKPVILLALFVLIQFVLDLSVFLKGLSVSSIYSKNKRVSEQNKLSLHLLMNNKVNSCLFRGQTMATNPKGIATVIMGVSGAGKSTIGKMLAEVKNCSFLDADDYHSQSNKEKMKKGIPLSDEDRIPWLETLRDAISNSLVNDRNVVLSCSALQKRYRDILRSADPNYKPGVDDCAVKFVQLDVKAEVLAVRVEKRAAEGQHFMPAKLLQSQLDLLQFDDSERIYRVDATQSPQATLKTIQNEISN